MALIYLWYWGHCTYKAATTSFPSRHIYTIRKCCLHVSVIDILHICFTFYSRPLIVRIIMYGALVSSIIAVKVISCYVRHVREVVKAWNIRHLRWQGRDHSLLIITLVLLLLIKWIILWVWTISENALIHRFKLLQLKFSVTRRFSCSLIHHVHALSRIISIRFTSFIHSGTVATWLWIWYIMFLIWLTLVVVTCHNKFFHVECLTLGHINIHIDIYW